MTNAQRTATRRRLGSRYADANEQSATIIAADPTRYPDGSLMSTWADLILSRAAEVNDADAGPLFKKAAA